MSGLAAASSNSEGCRIRQHFRWQVYRALMVGLEGQISTSLCQDSMPEHDLPAF